LISFLEIENIEPLSLFKSYYDKAQECNQEHIEAMCINSFDIDNNQPESRFVNLKFIKGAEFIFFSNYEGPKANQFHKNPKISAIFFWNKTYTQIKLKGEIFKTDKLFCDNYFAQRNKKKNALSISSNQSKAIESYDDVINKYKETLQNGDLTTRPDHWGGFSFIPNYFEFWRGNENRLNERKVFIKSQNQKWKKLYLEP